MKPNILMRLYVICFLVCCLCPPKAWADGQIRGLGHALLTMDARGYDGTDRGSAEQIQAATALEWSTYLGGPGDDGYWAAVATGNSGDVIVAGDCQSGFPTTPAAYDTSYNGGTYDGWIARLDPTRSGPAQLVWSTYLGGSGDDIILDLVLIGGDEDSVVVVGRTDSPDFPTTPGAFDETHNGMADAFVARLSAGGSELSYSTYLGGPLADWAQDVDSDASGNLTVVGSTGSQEFPTTPGAYDTSFNGALDAFVCRLDPSGTSLVYSTFLGGSGSEGFDRYAEFDLMGLAVDESQAATVVGYTASYDFPTTPGAYQTLNRGHANAFVARLDPAGAELEASTYIGGVTEDGAIQVTLSPHGPVVVGFTWSFDFPTTSGAYDRSANGGIDVFVSTFDHSLGELGYSTFIGGGGNDVPLGGAALDHGDVIFSGYCQDGFPVTPDAMDPTFNGYVDAMVVRLRPAGLGLDDLIYGTFLGGTDGDGAIGFAYEEGATPTTPGRVTLAGGTLSTDFPTTPGAFDLTHNGSWDAFVARIDSVGTVGIGPPEVSLPDASPRLARLGTPHPNPSPGAVSVPLYLADQARVRLRIFDVGGRLVSQLMDRELEPGVHEVAWVTGRGVSPGTYLVRVDAGAEYHSRKIVIAP